MSLCHCIFRFIGITYILITQKEIRVIGCGKIHKTAPRHNFKVLDFVFYLFFWVVEKGAVSLSARILSALDSLKHVGMVLTFFPAVATFAPHAILASFVVVSDSFLSVPVLANIRWVVDNLRLASKILPIMSIDTSF